VCVVAIDRVPLSSALNCSPMRLRLPTSRMISSMLAQHVLAGLGHALEALAVAGKDFDAQFFFQLDDGFGHAGLRGVQRFGGLGEVEIAAHGFLNKAKLVQVHI
jgi:hypothetical protein